MEGDAGRYAIFCSFGLKTRSRAKMKGLKNFCIEKYAG